MKKISTFTEVLIILVTVAILFGGVFAWQKLSPKPEILNSNQVQNPNSEITGWKTYTDNYGFLMQYPPSSGGAGVSVESPTSRVVSCNNTCPATMEVDNMNVGYQNQTINGVHYCVYHAGDSGMGHTYFEDLYVVVNNNSCYGLVIKYSSVNCSFYGEGAPTDPLVQKCLSEGKRNEELRNRAISTIKFTK